MSSTKLDPESTFHGEHYMRHNQRRLEHLASLRLDLQNCSVLEVGAGIADHTSFFLDRGCRVTVTEARPENLTLIEHRFPQLDVRHLDLDAPNTDFKDDFELVYCYGTLYHLSQPELALEFLAAHCTEALLLESCVSFHDNAQINAVEERVFDPSQAQSGRGCRPARSWIFAKLRSLFNYVYMPTTQPWHEEFPVDWTAIEPPANLNNLWRSVFIASRQSINSDVLIDYIPDRQIRL